MVEIIGQLYSSKNSKKIGTRKIRNKKTGILEIKPAIFSSDKSTKSDGGLLLQLQSKKLDWGIETGTMVLSEQGYWKKSTPTYPLKVKFKLYRVDAGKFDFVNIVQGLLDLMVKAGWLPDDDADHIIPSFEPYEIDRTNPRTQIFIEH